MTTTTRDRPGAIGYAHLEVTKVPNWHALVAWDLLFNNLTTGLFLVAALGELAAPTALEATARLAYPMALAFLVMDLLCLVFDLGDPLRFHHMLRVFKPSSPMSLGTWCLTAYSLPLTLIVAIDLGEYLQFLPGDSPALHAARTLTLILGLAPAFGSAAYKGVLFSTSAQPAWKDARWFGAYLVNSAFLFGVAGLLAIGLAGGRADAAASLRPAYRALLVANAIPLGLLLADLRPALGRLGNRAGVAGLVGIVAGVGLVVPLVLSLLPGPWPTAAGIACLLVGATALRFALVKLPVAFH